MTDSPEEPRDIVFVGGAMRSGTTLLQRILCSTPATNPLIGECRYLFSILRLQEETLSHFDLRGRDYFGDPEGLAAFTRNMCRDFIARTRRLYPDAKRLVLKSPELTRFFPLLAQWFPACLLVVIVRDPRDTIASMVEVSSKARATGRRSQVADLGRDMTRYCGVFMSTYTPITEDKAALAERLLLVRYEDLVHDPEVIARLSRFTGIALPVDAVAADASAGDRRSLEVRKASTISADFYAPLWAGGVTDSRIGRFRERLAEAEIAEIERRCAGFGKSFGYW